MTCVVAKCRNKTCNSQDHGEDLIAGLTHRDVNYKTLVKFALIICKNSIGVRDSIGRTALHIASSISRNSHFLFLQWIIEREKGSNLSKPLELRDFESGYTALHRSCFYGNITAAQYLINKGANLDAIDNEGWTPLDILNSHCRQISTRRFHDCTWLLVWGNNVNYNLGLGHQDERSLTRFDLSHDFFTRRHISIKEVVIQKYHTAFLTSDKKVYLCGHGEGGRLGVRETQLLPVQLLDKVVDVALGIDHSVFLLENGTVLTCGSNEFKQLGQLSSSKADPFTPKRFSVSSKIIGISAAKFHTCVYNDSSQVFICGYNVGQMGFVKDEEFIAEPRLITAVSKRYVWGIESSDQCVVIRTPTDLTMLFGFQTKKVTVSHLRIKALKVVDVHEDVNDNVNTLIRIFILLQNGNVTIWEPKLGFVQCIWNFPRNIQVFNFCVTNCNKLWLVSYEGFIYQQVKQEYLRKEASTCLKVKLKRLSGIHHALSISADPDGKNFAVLTSDPRKDSFGIIVTDPSTFFEDIGSLLEETVLSDVIFRVENETFSLHKYVLSCCSEKFAEKLNQKNNQKDIDNDDYDELKEIVDFEEEKNAFHELTQYAYFRLKTLPESLKSKYTLMEKNSDSFFSRNKFPEFYDAVILCSDEVEIKVHKCVLAARCEYFRSLFCHGWKESKSCRVTMKEASPIVLTAVVDYLYSDVLDLDIVDVFVLCEIAIIANQMLIFRLVQLCESRIADYLSFKSVFYVDEFAKNVVYLPRLRHECLIFLCQNIGYFLEKSASPDTIPYLFNVTQVYIHLFGLNKKEVSVVEVGGFDNLNVVPYDSTTTSEDDNSENSDVIDITEEEDDDDYDYNNNDDSLCLSNNLRVNNSLAKVKHKSRFKKLSQRERKRILLEQRKHIKQEEKDEEQRLNDWTGWNVDSNSECNPSPLIEIMKSEQIPVLKPETKFRVNKNKRSNWRSMNMEETTTKPAKKESPWLSIKQSNDFQRIIEEEKSKLMNLVRISQKPFKVTQREEKAIKELEDFYGVHHVTDEVITIQRVNKELPTSVLSWRKN